MRRLLITFFYAGLSPVAPGTAGSLAATAVLYLLLILNHPAWERWQFFLVISLVIVCALSIWLGKWAVTEYQRKDPQLFVLDEVAGILVTNLFLPRPGLLTLILAFVAFRVFDVTKPPPCKQLEKLPAGWGILCDDLCAGIYALLVCHIILRVLF